MEFVVLVLGVAAILGVAYLYLLPIIIAMRNRSPNVGFIAIITLAFGWSIIGWIVAFMMARQSDGPAALPAFARSKSPKRPSARAGALALPAPETPKAPVGPEAGWYRDPGDSTQQRYWNGSAWTEHFKPA